MKTGILTVCVNIYTDGYMYVCTCTFIVCLHLRFPEVRFLSSMLCFIDVHVAVLTSHWLIVVKRDKNR